MNAILQSRLTNLESALTALTDSFAANNPSPSAARDLVAADEALSASLEQLAAHQRNTARLRALRAASAALDARFTQALTALADARQTLLAVPLTPPPPSASSSSSSSKVNGSAARPVSHAAILAAARTALRVPRRTERPPAPPPPHTADGDANAPASAATEEGGVAVEVQNPGLRVLDERERAWLGPDGEGRGLGEEELPWPSEAMVARSGLARSQGWARAVYDEEGGGQGEEDVKREEEHETEERERQTATQTQQGQVQQRPRPGAGEEREKPKVFTGMELYDPEED